MHTHRPARAITFAAMLIGASAGVAVPAHAAAPPNLGGCPVFPPDSHWNTPIDHLPRDAHSDAYVTAIGAQANLKADFGSGLWNGGPIGIPYVLVPGDQRRVPVTFEYADESDPGPYPVPPNAPIEGGPQADGDRHILMLDRENCILYELYAAYPQAGGSWRAGSGAIFDLNSHALRPDTWTSADAAGLPILPGLVRYDEVAAGVIDHAIRFTVPRTQRAYVWPGRHLASSSNDRNLPPMGQRFRLKANFDIAGFAPDAQVILRALKRYGMINADNGSAWFMSGVPDERWDNDVLHQLRRIPGSAFEAVDATSLMLDANSGQARQPGGAPTVAATPPPTATPTAMPSAAPTDVPEPPSVTPTSSPTAVLALPTPAVAATVFLPLVRRDGRR